MPSLKETFQRFKLSITSPLVIAICNTWTNYSEVAYMHGVKYVCDRTVNIYVRLIWTLIVILMLAFATQLVCSIYLDFIEDPTRFYIENDRANIAQLLFPAVTVCPGMLFNSSKAKPFLMSLNLPENLTSTAVLKSLTEANGFLSWKFKYNNSKIATLQNVGALNSLTAETILKRTEWECAEFFYRCRFQGRYRKCSDIFHISKTFAGLCCSFNAPQITLEKITMKPFKSKRYSIRQGLSFILKNTYHDTIHNIRSPWFQILVHENSVYPNEYSFSKLVRKSQEILFRIKPIETVYAPEVRRQLNIHDRKCVLPGEVKLRFFSDYRQQNCLTECRTLMTLNLCGCVSYYLFRDATTPICDFNHIPCLSDNYERLWALKSQCDCEDSCEKVDYMSRVTTRSMEKTVKAIDTFYDGVHPNHTMIHVYMQSQLYRRVRRDIIWNIITLIGNLGNSFSISIGFSVLSLAQLLYFFTFVLRRNYKQTLQTGDKAFFKKSSHDNHRVEN